MNSLFLEYEEIKTKKDYMKVGNYFYWSDYLYIDDHIFRIESVDDDYVRYTYPNSSIYCPKTVYGKYINVLLKKAEPYFGQI